MTEHILIAHDLRSTADLALRRAAQLARQHGAKLTLLHVFDPKLDHAERERIEARVCNPARHCIVAALRVVRPSRT